MKWENNLIKHLQWPTAIINQEAKEKVAREIAGKVHNGNIIGAGSGSTVHLALFYIADKIKTENLQITIIPASIETYMTCLQLELPQTTLLEARPDWTFDGADEVDPEYNLIKGRGGAMFKEKLLISSSDETYILVDESKLVKQLGTHFPIPVEVFPGALSYVENSLKELKAREIILRSAQGKDGPVITENGNYILDVRFGQINTELEKEIKIIPGVIESGLFIGYPIHLLVTKTGQ